MQPKFLSAYTDPHCIFGGPSCRQLFRRFEPPEFLRQDAQIMLPRILTSLCLRALGSAAMGRVVRAGIVLASHNASPRRGKVINGGAGAVVPAQ